MGSWLTQAGYYTAFLGKYVNSMECDVPSGWRHWGGLTCSNLRTLGLRTKRHWQPMLIGESIDEPYHVCGVSYPLCTGGTRLGGTYNYKNSSRTCLRLCGLWQ